MKSDSNQWLSVAFTIPAERSEAAEDQLWVLGASSVTLKDASDQPIHEPDPGQTPLWPGLTIEALFDANIAPGSLTSALMVAGLIDDAESITFETLADRDWTRAWMDRFEPMEFGNGLWICPSHREPDPNWPVVLHLDPGLAFGSGTHPTTALCLEWLSALDLTGKIVIDYGCGSGVLAVAAALKGADHTLAIDHDRQALTATLDNAKRNHVAEKITVALPESADDTPVDLVLANILAGPLIELAPKLTALLRPGAQLVLSGILAEQAEAVSAAYRNRLQPVSSDLREEWVRLVFSRTA